MTRPPDLDMVARLSRRLPPADLDRLGQALLAGRAAVARLRSKAAGDIVRDACTELCDAVDLGADPSVLAGAVLGAGVATARQRAELRIDVVWTGPESPTATSRLTSEAIATVLDEARREILLVGYAVQNEPRVTTALHGAADRGVDITLLIERSADNPRYAGSGEAFMGLRARRLAWRAASRPSGGAALHAKVLVVDRRVALVGSANITGWALERNLECGILIRGGVDPGAIHAHIDALVAAGELRAV